MLTLETKNSIFYRNCFADSFFIRIFAPSIGPKTYAVGIASRSRLAFHASILFCEIANLCQKEEEFRTPSVYVSYACGGHAVLPEHIRRGSYVTIRF